MNKRIGIVGIHTNIGKTIASAVLAEALGADYWKPVQAGNIEERDSVIVRGLIHDGDLRVHPEALLLSEPMSPHAAAAIDKVQVDHKQFKWPETNKTLLVETAGGVLSPMSDNETMADFVAHYKLPVILVSQNYLGSINHTLLSIEVLRSRGIKILGLVMNGEPNSASESFVETYGKVPIMARVPFFTELKRSIVCDHAASIKHSLIEKINHGQHQE